METPNSAYSFKTYYITSIVFNRLDPYSLTKPLVIELWGFLEVMYWTYSIHSGEDLKFPPQVISISCTFFEYSSWTEK